MRAILLVALVGTVATPEGTIRQAFAIAHSGGKPAEALNGQPFVHVIQLISTSSTSGGFARYKIDRGSLRLSIGLEPKSTFGDPPHPELLMLTTRYTVAGSFAGRTALGARVRVQKRQDQTDALALVSAPLRDEVPATKYIPASRLYTYLVDLPATGAEAARIGRDVDVVIEGRIAALATGGVSACEKRFFEADVETPVDVYDTRCWIGADVSRISFRRRSSGQVIKEWVAGSSPQP